MAFGFTVVLALIWGLSLPLAFVTSPLHVAGSPDTRSLRVCECSPAVCISISASVKPGAPFLCKCLIQFEIHGHRKEGGKAALGAPDDPGKLLLALT